MFRRPGLTALILLLTASAASPTLARSTASPQKPSGSTQASQDDESNTVGEISEDVAQVRFQKLGYQNIGAWTRNGDYLETTATKDGKSYQLRLHVRTGAKQETPAPAQH